MTVNMNKVLFGLDDNEKFTFKTVIYTVLILAIAIGVNYLGSKVAEHISFPLYLDSLLTIGVVALCGLIPGIVCAFLSNVVLSITTHSTLLFSICHICTAITAWIVFFIDDYIFTKENESKPNGKPHLYSIDSFLWAGFWSSIINGLIGNAIAELVFAANPGRPSANIVFQGIYVAFPNLALANNFGGFLENLVDKMISALLSIALYFITKAILRRIHR